MELFHQCNHKAHTQSTVCNDQRQIPGDIFVLCCTRAYSWSPKINSAARGFLLSFFSGLDDPSAPADYSEYLDAESPANWGGGRRENRAAMNWDGPRTMISRADVDGYQLNKKGFKEFLFIS